MLRPFNRQRTVPLPTKLLLGLALLLLASFAVAQNNLGELLDAGAIKISPEEFRQDVVQRTIVGPSQIGTRTEVMYTSSGMIQGRSDPGSQAYLTGGAMVSIDGVWNIDDRARICSSLVIGKMFLPIRCQYWFKLKDDYFIADSEDRSAKVLRRTVKQ